MEMVLDKVDYRQKYDQIYNNSKAQIISYGISENYVPKWTELEAGKEYVANFYDENGVNFTIDVNEQGICLEDQSERGITLEDLAFGNSRSEKDSYKIGTHGEGFKLGALALVRNGKRVLLETIGHTIIFYLEHEAELHSTVLKSKIVPNERTQGTCAYLEMTGIEDVKKLFLFLNDDFQANGKLLLTSKNQKTSNYIFVNTLASQELPDSIFSYSLWRKQKVNRDRNLIDSPYLEIAKELASTTDKTEIFTWLQGLTEGFTGRMENELIREWLGNLRRKEFRTADLSAWKEVISEHRFVYFIDRNRKKREAMRFANPDKRFIFHPDYSLSSFFRNVLDMSSEKFPELYDLDIGCEKEGKIYYPLVEDFVEHIPRLEQVIMLSKALKEMGILKNSRRNGSTLTFDLKKQDEVNLKKGTREKQSSKYALAWVRFLNILSGLRSYLTIHQWGISFENVDGVFCAILDTLPSSFQLEITDASLIEEMEISVDYSPGKVIVPDLVYDLEVSPRLIANKKYTSIEIPALFSYPEALTTEQIADIMRSERYVQKIMKEQQKQKLPSFETELLERYAEYVSKQSKVYDQMSGMKIWEKTFKNAYGAKACVHTDAVSDRKAEYNFHHIVELPPSMEKIFKKWEICLSSSIHDMSLEMIGIIPRPQGEYQDWKSSPYYSLLKVFVRLKNVLEKIYDIQTKYTSDIKLQFVNPFLPQSHRWASGQVDKEIRMQLFRLFENTHLVENLSKINGAAFIEKKVIILKKDFTPGTFFHEYVHAATRLKDIDSKFEKYLSFIGLLAHLSESTEKEEKAFLRAYQKWR